MSRKLTTIIFYQNTPFTDFQNTIDFGSNDKRDSFFATHYAHTEKEIDYNMVRDRLTLRVAASTATWAFLSQCNYLAFDNPFDGVKYYCQVVEAHYLNNNVIQLNFIIDGLMTFCQGGIARYAKNVQIDRQHLTKSTFNKNLTYLKTNDDVLNFNTLEYIHQDNYPMTDLQVVFRSSVDLSKDFGTVNSPKIQTSAGVTFDGVVSPQNIYTTPYSRYNALMKALSKYPWITQNITSVILVPVVMLKKSNYEKVTMASAKDFDDLSIFTTGARSSDLGHIEDVSKTMPQIKSTFKVLDHPEVIRASYCNIELTNYQGQKVLIDPAFLDEDTGLDIQGELVLGYANQIYFYPKKYKSNGENLMSNLPNGAYLDNALVFKEFDSAPLLTDNYRLDVASTANQRQLAQNNQITGMAGNVMDKSQSLQDRMMSAISLTSDVSVGAITGKLTDEWQFYRKQNAEIADKKIEAPSISEMSTNNAFSIKQKFFGVTVKYSEIDQESLNSVINYHANFGYAWNRVGDLEDTNSMTYLNYAKFSGNWIIDDRKVPQSIMEQIRIQFENGVKIWHNPEMVDNPFRQSITNLNVRK